MATATQPALKKRVTLTVFDLSQFDKVSLYKDIDFPAKPTTIEEALAAVGNDKDVLLNVIYDGLVERAADQAKLDPASFFVDDDDAETPELYTGTPVDEKKGKAINLMVLNMSKAMGYDKSLSLEKRKSIKAAALAAIKASPQMLAFLQNA